MNQEHAKVTQAIQTALRSARLDDVVEVEGPNKLGGYRLTDGKHRVGLSRVPDGNLWCVSAWFDISDGLGELLAENTSRSRQREEVLGATASVRDAIMAAVEVIIEGRIGDALKESCDPPSADGGHGGAGGSSRFAVFRTARAFRARSSRNR